MLDLTGKLIVQTFQLENNDVIIIGSDGRDDIRIIDKESKTIDINQDETLFLKNIQKGKGDLENIFRNITEIGSLTDDCSLLRIEFKDRLPTLN